MTLLNSITFQSLIPGNGGEVLQSLVVSGATTPSLAFESGGATAINSLSSLGVALTTSGSSDILFILTKSNTVTVTSVSDNGPGLTWQRYNQVVVGTVVFELWWAVTNSPFNATITANFSATPGAASRATVFGVSGVNTSSPLDPNVSFPGSNSSNTNVSSLSPSSPLSTTLSKTMIISMVGSGNNFGTITEPSGYTSSGIALGTLEDISYIINSTIQSAVSPTYSWTTPSSPVAGIWIGIQSA